MSPWHRVKEYLVSFEPQGHGLRLLTRAIVGSSGFSRLPPCHDSKSIRYEERVRREFPVPGPGEFLYDDRHKVGSPRTRPGAVAPRVAIRG